MFFKNCCCGGQMPTAPSGCCESECCNADPIYEQPVEKCVTHDIYHEVNQDWVFM